MSTLRFNDHRELTAKFHSIGTCGHEIMKGQRIGYATSRSGRKSVICPACWAKWCAENVEADRLEGASFGYEACCGGRDGY